MKINILTIGHEQLEDDEVWRGPASIVFSIIGRVEVEDIQEFPDIDDFHRDFNAGVETFRAWMQDTWPQFKNPEFSKIVKNWRAQEPEGAEGQVVVSDLQGEFILYAMSEVFDDLLAELYALIPDTMEEAQEAMEQASATLELLDTILKGIER